MRHGTLDSHIPISRSGDLVKKPVERLLDKRATRRGGGGERGGKNKKKNSRGDRFQTKKLGVVRRTSSRCPAHEGHNTPHYSDHPTRTATRSVSLTRSMIGSAARRHRNGTGVLDQKRDGTTLTVRSARAEPVWGLVQGEAKSDRTEGEKSGRLSSMCPNDLDRRDGKAALIRRAQPVAGRIHTGAW